MLGDNIKTIRKSKKISINLLSSITGISLGYLSDLENNKASNPTMEKLQKIADALEVSVDEFMKPDEELSSTIEKITLNKKDKKDIRDVLNQVEQQLLTAEGLMFDGEPASPEAVQSLLDAMRVGMEIAKQRNKEKFTPKKFRK